MQRNADITFKIRGQEIQVKITRISDHYLIVSPYNELLVEELRNLHKARWQPKLKAWKVPINERNNYAISYLRGYRYFPDNNVGIINFQRRLFKHQEEGIKFALSRRRCILAFEMGLGKTLISIEVMERSGFSNWWIVAPYGAQMEWIRQLKKWKSKVYPCVTTTYESLHKRMEESSTTPQGVIFDESIKIKNPNAQRSHYASELCRLIRSNSQSYIILLSGAPAPKEPVDWWHQLECIFPGWIREGDKHKFIKRYAITQTQDHGYGQFQEIIGWNKEEIKKLGKRIAPLVMVKQKGDCFDLPAKIFDVIQCETSENTKEVARFLANNSQSAIIALERLRELSDGFQYNKDGTYTWVGSKKLEIVKQLLSFYDVENGGPGRLIIFAAFRASIIKLKEFVKENGWLSDTIDGRGFSNGGCLDMFDSTDNYNYCLICHASCVLGLNFSKTFCLCYYSNNFDPNSRIQSLERRDRPGMDSKVGTRIVDLINLPTDQKILDRLNERLTMQAVTLEEIKKCLNHM